MEVSHEQAGYEGRLSDLVAVVQDTVRRRWMTLLFVTAVVLALCVAGILTMTPTYTSEARVQIDPTRNPLATADDQASPGMTLTPEAIETEVTLVTSPDTAMDVVQRLHLDGNPVFTKGLQKPGQPKMSTEERQRAIADDLSTHVSVSREKLSYILSIKYTSKDAVTAAAVVNGFAQSYVDLKAGSKAGTAGRQADFFRQRLDALNREVNDASARAAQYRAQAGIVQNGPNNTMSSVVDEQITPLSTQLATSEAAAAAAHAQLAAAQQQIASGGLDSVSQVLSSPVIGDLRRQRSEVQRNVEEVQARYGEKHPESIRVHDQLDAIDKQIKDEARRVVDSLKANVSATDASVASLRGSMNRLEGQQASNTRAAVMADALQREATTKQAAYDRMSQLSLNSIEGSKNRISNAEIIEQATPLRRPTWPNKPLLIAVSLLLALAVGGGTIAVQEMLVTGMRTVEEVQSKLNLPVLAAIPKVPKSTTPSDMLLERPTSLFAESLRIARAAILGVRGSTPKKVIAITSALPSEGKTTTALSFARTLATNGAKTLLLECDVRRAQLRFMVVTPPTGPGIVEVLHGEATVEQTIVPGDVPNLDHLLVKAPYFSSGDLFGGGAMDALLDKLKLDYEQIVLDLPPLIGLADGRFLAVMADVVAVVVKWDATPAEAVSTALGWLRSDGANVAGVIYTMVDSSAEAIGGLYYSKKYSAYYQAA